MTKLEEGKLEFDFVGALDAYIFDDNQKHGAGAMNKVDFVVEWEEVVWLVEVKNPFKTPDLQEREEAVQQMRADLINDPLRFRDFLDSDDFQEIVIGLDKRNFQVALGRKARDTFLYLHLTKAFTDKPFIFIVFFADDSSDTQFLKTAIKELERACVLDGPSPDGWAMPYLTKVQILTFQSWHVLYPHVPIRRLPLEPSPPPSS